jgi:hypothetical protein
MLYWRVAFPDREKRVAPSTIDPFRSAVLLMALFAAFVLIANAYFADRQGGGDEIGLFNPTYMDLNYGKATYPVYNFYHSMPVHPPVHYKVIAMFMRCGFTLYYAQATPTIMLLLLSVWLIVRGQFPSPVKIGFLFGLCLSYVFFCKARIELGANEPVGYGAGMELFGMRPEGELGAAWMAGLLAFESGRQDHWNLPKLFLGSLLLTYAASLHFYGTVAVLGAAVYAGAAWWELGWPAARRAIGVIAAACLIYVVAELILWVIPQRADILYMIRGTGTSAGMGAAIREHVALYRHWAAQGIGPGWLRPPFLLGLPVVLISTPVLLVMRSTRWIALAALPVQVFLLLFAWHKHVYYFIHEVELYSAAVAAGLLTVLALALRNIPSLFLRRAIALAAAGLLAFSLWDVARLRSGVALSFQPRIHESEIARAAAREILGPNARVSSRTEMWFASGAADWYNATPKLLWSRNVTEPDAARYLSHFDAISESRHMSEATSNSDHKALLSWYLDGDLSVRGFFFADANDALSNLLLQSGATVPVRGYGLKNGQLHSFAQSTDGDHELAIIEGAYDAKIGGFGEQVLFHILMPLPDSSASHNQALLAVVVGPGGPRDYERMLPNGRIIQKLALSARTVDANALVAKLRREDRPIRFHEPGALLTTEYVGGEADIDQSGFADPPPADAVALTKVIRVEELAAAGGSKIESGPKPLVTIVPGMGAFGAVEPIHDGSSVGVDVWIQISARVPRGRVAFGLLNQAAKDFVYEPAILAATGSRAIDVFLSVPSLEDADELIIRNQESGIASQVVVDRIIVWVRREDWEHHRAALDRLR